MDIGASPDGWDILAVPADFRVAEYDVPAVTLRAVGEPPDVDAFFEALTTRVRGDEIVIVDRPVTEDGADRDRSVWALVESVGECAAVRRGMVSLADPDPALVLASPAIIRNMCAAVDPLPEDDAITSSDPVRWTYRAFEQQWTHDIDPGDYWRLPPDVGGRKHELYEGIGERMGELHRIGMVWSDAHAENFLLSMDRGVMVVDLEDHARVLYRAPTAVRSATDLVPLLSGLWPPQWDWLRAGYRAGRGPDAEPVIELIERNEPPAPAERARFLRSSPRRRVIGS
jgi:hypothetical protein